VLEKLVDLVLVLLKNYKKLMKEAKLSRYKKNYILKLFNK
jgi:hypothetical protein